METEKPRDPQDSPNWLEQRASVRYEFGVRVEIDSNGWKLWGRIRNLSRTGLFIELPAGVPIPTDSFHARLALHKPLRVECVVRRIVPGQGIGVSIEIPDRIAALRYAALLVALSLEGPPEDALSVQESEQPAVAECSPI